MKNLHYSDTESEVQERKNVFFVMINCNFFREIKQLFLIEIGTLA